MHSVVLCFLMLNRPIMKLESEEIREILMTGKDSIELSLCSLKLSECFLVIGFNEVSTFSHF